MKAASTLKLPEETRYLYIMLRKLRSRLRKETYVCMFYGFIIITVGLESNIFVKIFEPNLTLFLRFKQTDDGKWLVGGSSDKIDKIKI